MSDEKSSAAADDDNILLKRGGKCQKRKMIVRKWIETGGKKGTCGTLL
jgi:hypothetical protein